MTTSRRALNNHLNVAARLVYLAALLRSWQNLHSGGVDLRVNGSGGRPEKSRGAASSRGHFLDGLIHDGGEVARFCAHDNAA